MKLIKAITHLKRKFTQPKFFVNDYDQECLNTVIDFYNETETGTKLTFENYYQLVLMIFRYEIINAKLNRLLRHGEESYPDKELSILDIRDEVAKKIVNSDWKTQWALLTIDADIQKLNNYEAKNQKSIFDLTIEDIQNDKEAYLKASLLTEKNKDDMERIIKGITTQIILNESHKNK